MFDEYADSYKKIENQQVSDSGKAHYDEDRIGAAGSPGAPARGEARLARGVRLHRRGQAFIYGFPYIYNARLRHRWVTHKQDPDLVPYAAVNQFWHAKRLMDAGFRSGGCPSTDSLYSLAWFDLSEEPIILSHPDMGERYFTFELAAFTSDNFGYVGQRATGHGGGCLRHRRPRLGR